MPNCVDEGRDDLDRCRTFEDHGYERCDRFEDHGHEACDRWDKHCCGWWPCSWACKLVTWVCAASTWIANVVCVATTWVANKVCVAWDVTAYLVCTLADAIVTAVAAVVDVVEAVLGWFLSVFAWFWDLLLSIPVVGRLIKAIWNVALTVIWGLASVADAAGYLIGVRPEKKLRVCTVLLCDEHENEEGFAKRAHIVEELNKAIDIYRQAHVRIIPSRPLQIRSGFGAPEVADDSWITVFCPRGGNNASVLEVDCNVVGALQDLWNVGPQLQFILDTTCSFGNYRRMIGYGAPVTVFVIRDVAGKEAAGCGGPFWDYLLVEIVSRSTFASGNQVGHTIAHELGHACNLTHVPIADNLMRGDEAPFDATDLTTWQQVLIRMSRHVSYL